MLENFVRPEHAHWDLGTHKEVILEDCYRIADVPFLDSDTVMDVGANIGLFSGLALERGAGKVIAVEASPHNFSALVRNLNQWSIERVTVLNRAVWRSDQPSKLLHLNPLPADGNTGGVNVLENAGPDTVYTVGLDELIGDKTISFLKVDCEGSEYPILYTSKKLHQVKRLVIEVHPVDHLMQADANVRPGENTPEHLTVYLVGQGFEIHCQARTGMDAGWAYIWGHR